MFTYACPKGRSALAVPLLVLALLAGLFFTPCSATAAEKEQATEELHVLTSTFPVYLFTRNVTRHRPNVKVELLVPAQNGCPHNYAPTPTDLQKLARAQVLVLNGLGFEDFLMPALHKVNDKVIRIDSSRGIDPLPLPQDASGSHKNCTQDHDHSAAGEGHGHCHGHGQWNPHIFAGPQQAASMVHNIGEGLAKADPAGAESYRKAAEEYTARLLSLGRRLQEIGLGAKKRGVVLQHDALAYAMQNAGLDVVDVIESSEGEQPSAARLMELIKRIKKHDPVLIVGEPQYSDKTAQTLSRETGVPAVSLDPVVSGPVDAPLSYYEAVMARNCQILERYFD